nr:unnamed protein product [Haemonchus contortus]
MNGKGLSMEDRYKVVDQIQFMSSSYNPMQCNNVNVQPANTRADALIRFDSESSGSAYNCVVNEDRIGSICPGTKCSVNGGEVAVGDHKEQFASLQPIPQEFVTYKVNLKSVVPKLPVLKGTSAREFREATYASERKQISSVRFIAELE